MKKLLFFISFGLMIFSQRISAEKEYENIMDEGKVWTMRYELVVAPEYGKPIRFEEIKLEGDAVFEGKTYKKVWSRNWGEWESKPEQWHFGGYIRQEGGKVYQKGDNLILDFSAQIGDEVFVNNAEEMVKGGFCKNLVVEEVTDETICGKKRKCLKLRYLQHPDFTETWIEGIGSLNFGIWGDRLEWGGSRMSLDKCTQNGDVIYSAEGEATAIEKVHSSKFIVHSEDWFTLDGRHISGQSKPGIYIRDGRKVVVE